MEANKAPEKIYINDFGSELSFDWHQEHCADNDIEYTRTDAFIDKAAQWLTKHAIKYYLGGSKFLGTEEMVEDFKIAMKL